MSGKQTAAAPNLKTHYFSYYNKTFFIDIDHEHREKGYLLNLHDGDFDERSDLIAEVVFATTEDIHPRSHEAFIVNTEECRADHLRGDGPIFALYETIEGLYEQRKAENRRFPEQERALINTLRPRTFHMWDEEFERRAAGDDATFQYRWVLP
ncbi:hypothetical protein [Saccharopolyspora gloriosae]|uniref:hypothetical protein n=1 Tax=Saccharopolyspora gloriosae TaxID=455344 RepID=UPI001FB842E3|nr:hypothetical protein [Saccharopolyspora gloriosae]